MSWSVPVTVDGVLRFDTIRAAARYAYHMGWAVDEESAYKRIRIAAQGVNHRVWGHTFEKGWKCGQSGD